MDGGTSSGSVAVQLDANALCQTNTIISGYLQYVSSALVVRLDSSASISWNAYSGLTISVLNTGGTGTYSSAVIRSYAGNVTGNLISSLFSVTSVTVDLTCAYCASPTASLYNGVYIDIDVDGNPLTGDDIYTGIISAYTAGGMVTCSAGFSRTSAKGVVEIYSNLSGRVMSASSTYTIYSRVCSFIQFVFYVHWLNARLGFRLQHYRYHFRMLGSQTQLRHSALALRSTP